MVRLIALLTVLLTPVLASAQNLASPGFRCTEATSAPPSFGVTGAIGLWCPSTGPNAHTMVLRLGGVDTQLNSGGGAVSSVSNSDGSLTVSPTTGAVVGSINLAHANTWSGVQTFRNATALINNSVNDAHTTLASDAGLNRIWTLPDATDTAVGLSATQTLLNKTLTAPIINGLTSLGSTAINFGGNSGTFATPTGAATFGGSSNNFSAAPLKLSFDVNGASVSAANTALFGYNNSTHTLQVSLDGAAWADIGGGGGGGVSLSNANTWLKSQNVASVALVDGATINTNALLGNTFTVTIAGDRTIANPTGLVSGGYYAWEVVQDGSGGHLITWGNKFTWPGGTAPILQTAASAKDLITCAYDGTDLLCGSLASTGSVSSVGMSVPSWLTVVGSPITSSGTLAVTATTGQTANRFLATPNGSTGAVSLRALVNADLPTSGVTAGTFQGITVNDRGIITNAVNTGGGTAVPSGCTLGATWSPGGGTCTIAAGATASYFEVTATMGHNGGANFGAHTISAVEFFHVSWTSSPYSTTSGFTCEAADKFTADAFRNQFNIDIRMLFQKSATAPAMYIENTPTANPAIDAVYVFSCTGGGS